MRRKPKAADAITSSWKRFRSRLSLSHVQGIIGMLAGVISIVGALFSVSPFLRAFTNGELVATVQEASSHRGVSDATIEVLTPQNEIVATLKPDATGRATQDLREGAYVVRVSHPRYAADVRRIQVFSRQTVELHATLHAGSSAPSSLERAVNSGIRAVGKALRF